MIGIRVEKRIATPVAEEALLAAVVKAAFSTRRKTVKNALANISIKVDAATIKNVLAQAEIDPGRRAEALSVEEFGDLTTAFFDYRK